jgi:hypothetical protein
MLTTAKQPTPKSKKALQREERSHFIAAKYIDDYCDRCRDNEATTETRRHMLVDCPANALIVQNLQQKLVDITRASVNVPVRSVPNWFCSSNTQLCNNLDSQVHLELGRYDKVAGMVGMFPKLALEWLQSLGLPEKRAVAVAKTLNEQIIRASRYMFRRRNAMTHQAAMKRLPAVRQMYTPSNKRKRKK